MKINFLQNEHSATCDLSDQRLILLPEALLNSDDISHLNLRRNSLMSRPQVLLTFTCSECSLQSSLQNFPTAPIGTVDDISRLMSLTSLDLSFNQLKAFPFSLVHLPFLRSLNLSSNCIADLPPDIGSMARQGKSCWKWIWQKWSFERITTDDMVTIPSCRYVKIPLQSHHWPKCLCKNRRTLHSENEC